MTLTVTVGGNAVAIKESSLQIDSSIDERSTASFVIYDSVGSTHYSRGQTVVVVDSTLGTLFNGFINDAEEMKLIPSAGINTTISAVDQRYLVDNRLFTNVEYVNRLSGDIVADVANTYLAAEGITINAAVDHDNSQTTFAAGTLTNMISTVNDLELTASGTIVDIVENGSTFTTGTVNNTHVVNGNLIAKSFPAIKIVANNTVNNAGNTYTYLKIWSGSYPISGSGNVRLLYDVFMLPSCPEFKIGIDCVCTDGTRLAATATLANSGFDVQSQSPHPGTDLSNFANGQWYSRNFLLSNSLSGKTISYVTIACEGDKLGLYTGYIRNLIFNDTGSITNIFSSTATKIQYGPQQLQTYGYASAVVSFANCFNPSEDRVSPSYSIDAAKINAFNYLTWSATTTVHGISNGSNVVVGYSLDAGASYVICTNNSPLPDFPVGLSTAGKSIQFIQYLLGGNTPEDTCTLNYFEFSIQPGYSGTKTDNEYQANTLAAYNAGTYSNTVFTSGTLALASTLRNWDNADTSNQPLYGGPGAEIFVSSKALVIGVDGIGTTGYDGKCQNVFAPTPQDFIAEVDVLIGGWDSGFIYRTVNWGNGAGTYAFAALVSQTSVYLALGNDSSSSTNTSPSIVASAAVTLTAGNWHRLKVIASGTSHKIYLDDVQMINTTSASFVHSGYTGLIIRNGNASAPTHRQAQFNNFGMIPGASLSGTWISPSISLNSVATYANSDFLYAIQSTDLTNCTILAEYTLNGGSTWTTIVGTINGNNYFVGSLTGMTIGQSLTGVSIQLRMTVTTTTAASLPAFNEILMKIIGGFSATGTRISPVLAIGSLGRCGSSSITWNATVPTSTTLTVQTSPDATTWSTATNGGAISGLTSQPDPTVDGFSINTSANYTSTFRTGGATATWAYDTTNSRITATGGTTALFVLNTLTSIGDVDIVIDVDESDAGGMIWHYIDGNNYYELVVADASASTNANTVYVYKIVSGTRTALLSALSIAFTRGTYHRIRMTMLSNAIKIQYDGTIIGNATDLSLASGKCGFRSDGGTSRYYQLWIEPQGTALSTQVLYSKVIMTSTDPTISPTMTDLTMAVRSQNIDSGAIVPLTSYQYKSKIGSILDDLARINGYWWGIDVNKNIYFQNRPATLSPFILQSTDLLALASPKVKNISSLYRNRQWILGGFDTTTLTTDNRTGDGYTQTWSVAYAIAPVTTSTPAPVITRNGTIQKVGVSGVDSNKNFYYKVGDVVISQDPLALPLSTSETLIIQYYGQIPVVVSADNTTQQTLLASYQGGTGIVEEVETASGLNKSAALQLAQARLTQYAILASTLTFDTLRPGLGAGQQLSAFIAEHGIFDQQYLITKVKIKPRMQGNVVVQYVYTVEATSGPSIGSWTKLFVALGQAASNH